MHFREHKTHRRYPIHDSGGEVAGNHTVSGVLRGWNSDFLHTEIALSDVFRLLKNQISLFKKETIRKKSGLNFPKMSSFSESGV